MNKAYNIDIVNADTSLFNLEKNVSDSALDERCATYQTKLIRALPVGEHVAFNECPDDIDNPTKDDWMEIRITRIR